MNPRVGATYERARTVWGGFTAGQRAVLVVAAVGLVLGAVVLTRFAAQPTWSPLFSNLSSTDAGAVVEQLKAQNVPYQLAGGGGTVLVPEAQVYDLRVSLAGKNLPSGDAGGWSLLDKQGMTSTDFQQNVAYQRALEGELSKTLGAMQGVQTAIVHIAIPKKDVFSSTADRPTASVLLALAPGTTPGRSQVRSVMHLVAGSVPGLDPSDVTVTDAKGSLLSTRADGAGGAGGADAASETDEQTAQFEDRMGTSLQQMLDRVLGAGHAVVRVNAQLNFDTTQSTKQTFVAPSPSMPPVKEATTSETYNNAGAGAGGAMGQTWPTLTATQGAGGGGSYAKSERTVENPVGTEVTKTDAAPGGIKRLTVAVVLDAKTATANPGVVEQLVSNAVGLDAKRGDTIQVSAIPFDTTAAQAAAKELGQAQAAAAQAGYLDLAKKAAIGLAVLILLLVSWRRRRKAGATVTAVASDLPAEGSLVLAAQAALEERRMAALEAGPAELEDENAKARRARVREELSAFVEKQPDEIASLVQGWLAERKG